ncbi:MAG TPA: hypothetical protein VMK66_07070 [Myxococcales bacterium]|nr:hypothetical protein [Myxococcales bacterium]
MRPLALLLLLAPSLALADEVDLSHGSQREAGYQPTFVVRLEAGNEFAPFGYVGGCLSYLVDPQDAFELGAGGGFPGAQIGLSARHFFGEGGTHFLGELFIAGNTRVNRGADQSTSQVNAAGSSLWTGLGFGFEQRADFLNFSVAGNIIFTTSNFTPHWSVHGGVGFGF